MDGSSLSVTPPPRTDPVCGSVLTRTGEPTPRHVRRTPKDLDTGTSDRLKWSSESREVPVTILVEFTVRVNDGRVRSQSSRKRCLSEEEVGVHKYRSQLGTYRRGGCVCGTGGEGPVTPNPTPSFLHGSEERDSGLDVPTSHRERVRWSPDVTWFLQVRVKVGENPPLRTRESRSQEKFKLSIIVSNIIPKQLL